jgi:hypothetical protein
MRSPCRYSLLLLSALWLSAPRPALAADVANRRVLLIEQGRDPFLERVGAEIEKLGFSLVRTDTNVPLEAAARAEQALCAIRVLPSRTGVEVWMADATSGRSLLRQVVVDESPGGPDRDLIALQTAELLRTSLLGESSAPEEQQQPVPAPAPAPAPAPQTAASPTPQPATMHERNTGVQLAGGALYSPGGASAAIELGLSLQRFFGERWGMGLDLSMPISSGTLTGIEGKAQLRPYFAGLALLARLSPHASPFFATAGAGVSLLFVDYDADAREPLRSSSGHRWMQAVYLRVDVGLDLVAWLRVGVRGIAGASAQRLSLDFAGNSAGSFGPALFAGFAFIELALP